MNELNGFKDTTEKMNNKLSECKLAENVYLNMRGVIAEDGGMWALRQAIIDTAGPERSLPYGVGVVEGPVAPPIGRPPYGVYYDKPIIKVCMDAIKNKLDGLQREHKVEAELKKQYSPEKGDSIVSEAYLRDKNGNIVIDPITVEARRIDFVVVKDGKVVDSIEVTSKTADKTNQVAKEQRIREAGGNYIRTSDGKLIEVPSGVSTRIERRD